MVCSWSLPSGDSTTGCTPKNGNVAEPGFVAMAPGNGAIMWPPVSVCHHASTIEQRSLPTCLWYQSQASGLIGSPTVPSVRSVGIGCASGYCGPAPISARIAVGAVWKMLTLCFSTTCQKRSGAG